MLVPFWLVVSTHVPTYGACTENCCTPPHIHTTSQVVYLKGSGGLEIHFDSETSPFNIMDGEMIDFDAVFRDQIDPSTYSLYVGCGGCVPSEDKIVIDPVDLSGYQPAHVEPYSPTHSPSAHLTLHSLHSYMPTDSRKRAIVVSLRKQTVSSTRVCFQVLCATRGISPYVSLIT
jgi:hypothetical protein